MTNMSEKYVQHKKLSNSSKRTCGGVRGYSRPAEGLHIIFAWISWGPNEPISPACPGPSLQQFFIWMFLPQFDVTYKPALCKMLQSILALESWGKPLIDPSSRILYCWSHPLTVHPSFNPSYHPLIQSIAHHKLSKSMLAIISYVHILPEIRNYMQEDMLWNLL